jgi:hypothetical protein
LSFLGGLLSDQANFKQLGLTDRTYQALVRSIASLVKREQRLYISGSTHGSYHTNSRLAIAADTFRKLIEVGCRTFRAKTAREVLFHIKEVLPMNTTIDELCLPLVNPYIKCLLLICSYPPHMDHLQSRDWKELVLFCSASLSAIAKSVIVDSSQGYDNSGSGTPSSSQLRMPVSCRDMLEVMRLFLANKMVRDISAFATAFSHLKFILLSFPNETAGHALLFECLSIILCCVTVQDVEFAKTVSVAGLNACLNLFDSKATELREQLCIFICHACRALRLTVTSSEDDDEEIRSILIACYDQLANVKLQSLPFRLSSDDVTFYNNRKHDTAEFTSWLAYPLMKLGYKKPQLGWLATMAISRLVCLIESRRFIVHHDGDDDEGHQRTYNDYLNGKNIMKTLILFVLL